MINATFVIWRECFEAVLIVGILISFLARRENFKRSRIFLMLGIAGGIVLSAFIAYGIQHAQTELEGMALEYFDAGMLILAAILMTHMCIWMKSHARQLKTDLEKGLSEALSTSHLIGISIIAALAIAREAAEIVIFFYGMGIEAEDSGRFQSLVLYSLLGVALTAVTAWAYFKGLKRFSPKRFFQITSVFLLITASALLLFATRKLIQMDVLPTIRDQVWDTSFLLDERTEFGQFISTITGYESSPSLTVILVAGLYWLIALGFYFGWFEKLLARRRLVES